MTPAHAGRDEHRIYCGGSGHSHRARDGVMLSHKSFSYFCTISSLAASGLVAMVSLHLPSSGQGRSLLFTEGACTSTMQRRQNVDGQKSFSSCQELAAGQNLNFIITFLIQEVHINPRPLLK